MLGIVAGLVTDDIVYDRDGTVILEHTPKQYCRAVRARKLTRFSCPKFKLVWHQFSTVQFHSHRLLWKVRSVQFGARGPGSVQIIQFITRTIPAPAQIDLADSVQLRLGPVHRIPIVWEEQRISSRSPLLEIPARRHGVGVEGWRVLLAMLACLPGM